MSILNQPELLATMKSRFEHNKVTTYVGNTVMAMNPRLPAEERGKAKPPPDLFEKLQEKAM